jgi:phosphoglycolate phosphatase
MYTCVFFDFDGTLYDTVEGITKSVRYALAKQGIEARLEDLRCFAGPPLEDMFMEKFGFDLARAKQAVLDFRERYVPIGLYESRAFPGMRAFLTSLRGAGIKLAVTTSKPERLARELLRREGLEDCFDLICGAGDGGEGNAKWQVLTRAMDALGAEPDRAVLVGDTKYDVEGAKRCALPCIGVRYGYAAPGELEAAGAWRMAEDLDSLREILLS